MSPADMSPQDARSSHSSNSPHLDLTHSRREQEAPDSSQGNTQATGIQQKRGSRACTACRKGKNRCEGADDPPCRRCRASGQACVFEKPEKGHLDEASLERVASLERQVMSMQGSMFGVQNKIDELIGVLRTNAVAVAAAPMPSPFPQQAPLHSSFGPPPGNPEAAFSAPQTSSSGGFDAPQTPSVVWETTQPRHPVGPGQGSALVHPSAGLSSFGEHRPLPQVDRIKSTQPVPSTIPGFQPAPRDLILPDPRPRGAAAKRARVQTPPDTSSHVSGQSRLGDPQDRRGFPPLPKYPAPSHPIQHYGLGVSTAPSSDDEGDMVPSSSLTAPFEALAEAAAAAASENEPAAATGEGRPSKRRRKRMPPPPNAFPSVVTKGIVSDAEARGLVDYYFAHCNHHLPFFDPSYDTYEGLFQRTPFSFNSICMVALRVKCASGAPSQLYMDVAEEAHGIARSTLFAATVRVEGVQAVLVQAAWNENGYLSTGHALRMGMELGLNRAIGKLRDGRPQADNYEERLLVVSARVWLALYVQDFAMGLGTGRPLTMRDSERITAADCRAFLAHPMSCPTDISLVAGVELIGNKMRIIEHMAAVKGDLSGSTMAFVRRMRKDVDRWRREWDQELSRFYDEKHFQRVQLWVKYANARVFLYCTALQRHHASGSDLGPDDRELAVEARSAASDHLESIIRSQVYRQSLKAARHVTLIDAAFSALLSLKMTKLLPEGVNATRLAADVDDMATLLSECPQSKRYAITVRIAVERFRRTTMSPGGTFLAASMPLRSDVGDLNGLEFDYRNLLGMVPTEWSGSAPLPDWIRDDSLNDVGFPLQGIDRQFLPVWSLGQLGDDPNNHSAYTASGEGIAW